MRPKPLMPTRMVMGLETPSRLGARRRSLSVPATGAVTTSSWTRDRPYGIPIRRRRPRGGQETGTRLRNQHVRRQVRVRPRDAVLGRLAVGHGEQTPDPTRDGVLGHGRIGELAELLQAG